MMSLILVAAAWADCHVEQLDTRVRFLDGAALREDRITLVVGSGAPCTAWRLDGGDPDATLLAVRGRVRRPDRRAVRLGLDRVVDPAGPWRAPPTRTLILPDALLGSVVDIVIKWRVPADQLIWDPAPQGPVASASLTVEGGAPWRGDARLPGAEAARNSWAWTNVADQTRPLVVRGDGAEPASPTPLAPAGARPAWRLARVGDTAVLYGPEKSVSSVPVVYGQVSVLDLQRVVGHGAIEFPVEAVDVAASAWPDGVRCSSGEDALGALGCTVAAALPDAWIAVSAVGVGHEDFSPAGAPDSVAGRLELALAPHQSANPDEPPVGTARWSWRVSARDPGDGAGHRDAASAHSAFGMRGFTGPLGARDLACSVTLHARDVAGTVVGRRCTFPTAASGTITAWAWEWREDRVPVVGEVRLAEAWGARSASLEIVAPGADVAVLGTPGVTVTAIADGSRAEAHDVAPTAKDGLLAPAAARVTWRLRSIGERAVLSNRAATLDLLALRALRASMPEPALPLEYKHRQDGEDLVASVLSLVRQRLVPGRVPGQRPLHTRLLVDALRSGWGTDWEQALLLTRYLRQLKLDALPVAVRPRAAGVADPAAPVGYESAVVRVVKGDTTMWLAPACQLCGPGELPPELGGAQVMSRGLEFLPAAAPGRLDAVQRGDGTATVTLAGAAALDLRRHLRQAPLEDRYDAVLGWLRVPGATLDAHAGLATRGGEITLELDLPVGWTRPLGPALPRPALDGPPQVAVPWAGTLQWRRERRQDEPVVAMERSMPGLHWRRQADAGWVTEVLTIEDALLARTDAARLLAEVHAVRSGIRSDKRAIEAAPTQEGDDLIKHGGLYHDE